jgi:hypothetical protein
MAIDVEGKTQIYDATTEELFQLSDYLAGSVKRQQRFNEVIATANGGLILGCCIGEALGIQVQTMRVGTFDMPGSDVTIPVIKPLDIIRKNSSQAIIATDYIDEARLRLFRDILPEAEIAANYSLLGPDDAIQARYVGKVLLPGSEVRLQFCQDA